MIQNPMNRSKSIAVAGIFMVLAGFLRAQSAYDAIHIMDRELGLGTRALAMGGAYAGLADDYTAIYWNPAGLGFIEESELFAELSHLNFNNKALFADQWTVDNQTYTRLRSAGVAIPVPTSRGSLVLALGYNRILNFDDNLLFSGFSSRPNGLGFDIAQDNGVTDYYPFDKNVHRGEEVTSEGGLRHWSLGGAIALSPNVMLGVTAAYVNGKEQYRLRFAQADINDLYDEFPGDFDRYTIRQVLQSDYSAFNVKIGSLIRLVGGLKAGGVMTLPSRYFVQEAHSTSDELTFDDGYTDATEESGRWDYRVTTPFYFDGGLSYGSRLLTVSASARYRDWSQTRFDVQSSDLDDAGTREFLEENDQIRQNYGPTTEYHLGGEISLEPLNTKLRGGFAVYPSPLKTASHKQDRQFLTGGVSYTIDKYVRFDITYLHGTWQREVMDSYTPAGTVEDITMKKVLFGLSYQF